MDVGGLDLCRFQRMCTYIAAVLLVCHEQFYATCRYASHIAWHGVLWLYVAHMVTESGAPIRDPVDCVRVSRTRYGLESPEDFGRAFGPWQQAMEFGGAVVADAWLTASRDLNRQFGPIAWPPCCGCGVSGGRCCATGQSSLDARKVQLKRLSARARPRQTAARKAGDTSGIVEELAVLLEEAGACRPKHARQRQLQEWKG